MSDKVSTKYMAEFIGTCMLVFFGCGSAILAGPYIGIIGVAFSFGLALMIVIYTLGPISGAHVNPAVTLCLFLARKFPGSQVVGYMVSQLLGAALAGAILYFIASGMTGFDITKGFALTGLGEHSPHGYSIRAGFLTEVLMTTVLLFAVLSTAKAKFDPRLSGLIISNTLIVIHIVSIPITNTSVNLARSFGVAIIHKGWALQQLWLFAAAHLIAVFLAIALNKLTTTEK
ncbi:MAG: aquaporin [Alphaproteobacteria bacterium]|nr:aquaporin [Alphaproteobacteria bacterium]